jgi:hypothetical protein
VLPEVAPLQSSRPQSLWISSHPCERIRTYRSHHKRSRVSCCINGSTIAKPPAAPDRPPNPGMSKLRLRTFKGLARGRAKTYLFLCKQGAHGSMSSSRLDVRGFSRWWRLWCPLAQPIAMTIEPLRGSLGARLEADPRLRPPKRATRRAADTYVFILGFCRR